MVGMPLEDSGVAVGVMALGAGALVSPVPGEQIVGFALMQGVAGQA